MLSGAGFAFILLMTHVQGITLASGGQSTYTIVLANDAIPAEHTAADELQRHLEQITGVRLPITSETEAPANGRLIILGPGDRFKTAFPDVDLAALKQDGIVLKTAGDTLYLAGGRPRGTLYAVYTFLEDMAGCRWWTATESTIPQKDTLEIGALDKVYTPKLLYREAFYRGAFEGVFAARSKCNGHFEQIAPEYGGHYSILGWCHTFYQLLPPEKYFQEHPDWYSEIDGKRVDQNAQLCLANEAMKAELIKNAMEWIRRQPEAGIISIAQNDCGGRCQCAECLAVENEEGVAAGPLIRFVNSVAEAIEKEFPSMWVETLAYQYTRQAPKLVKPRENVIVRLCSIECCFAQPLATGPQNSEFSRDMEAWSAIAPHLYVWDYVTNFANYILPHPNLNVLADNIRFFVDHRTLGLFEQGDAGSTCSDFPELRAWLLAHLMWDPSRDADALIREFLQGYYGAAAEPLGQYITLMQNAVERSGACLRCFLEDTADWCSLEDMNQATALFNAAAQAVQDDPTLSPRVRRARLPLDHAWLTRYPVLRRLAKGEAKPFAGPEDPVVACDEFINTCNQFNVGQYREGRPFADYAPQLQARFRAPAPAPEECAQRAEEEWVDIQDNEFRLYEPGRLSEIVTDPKASDGKAARMPANHGQWAVQYPISADITALGSWHCYVSARCEAKAAQGAGAQLGIYDAKNRQDVARATAENGIADGPYKTYDLGAHVLTSDMYVWSAPIVNPDIVDAVYIDRIFFIKDK